MGTLLLGGHRLRFCIQHDGVCVGPGEHLADDDGDFCSMRTADKVDLCCSEVRVLIHPDANLENVERLLKKIIEAVKEKGWTPWGLDEHGMAIEPDPESDINCACPAYHERPIGF